ncbi:hypothetical protein J3R83DRAFT_2296 [Lanmaoa asiatica]|nr:hypothetical protein J3R83DRAFT_2296 [Lanmaoa asiatica]
MCRDCITQELYCQNCLVKAHACNPLHTVKKWNGMFYESVLLKALGLRIQLGHPCGQKCRNPERAFDDTFVVVDTNGIHTVSLDFCGCELAMSHFQQLLRFAWFPATTSRPKTAATFRVLKQFHLVSLESKISVYQYYNTLAKLIDNTGLVEVKDRYESFLRMTREWQHLKMLKRAGRSFVEGGFSTTSEGQCAVLCPACPHPGKNLPQHNHDVPENKQYAHVFVFNGILIRIYHSWLTALFVAIDANFRLKHKKVSKDSMDPSLSKGWAYFVEETSYKSYLSGAANATQERSTCSGHSAVNMADTKANQGLAATGVGTVDCARHNMKLPNGIGDLQKGEKYINMDYLFFSAMRHNPADILKVSYNIACQWSKNLWEQMSMRIPLQMHLQPDTKQVAFSFPNSTYPHTCKHVRPYFHFTSSLELVERMERPRRESLKLKKLKEAMRWRSEFSEGLQQLEGALAIEHADDLKQWKRLVCEWEADPSKLNPFERQGDVISMASVRLALAQEEAVELQSGRVNVLLEDCTGSALIGSSLELEEQQRHLKNERAGLGLHATDNQQANLTQQSNTLQRRIDGWVKLQHLFLPFLAGKRAKNTSDMDAIIPPELFRLQLPSEIGNRFPVDERLQDIEWRLRLGQAHDALHSIRSNLRIRSYILKYKDHNLRGQGANTRAQNTVKKINARIDTAAGRYRDAHAALVMLSPLLRRTGWNSDLRPLLAEDIRGMSDLLDGETGGRRKVSWIWNTVHKIGTGFNADHVLEGEYMRIEWCKARARVHRWSEEVELLVEEMRQIPEFFKWEAKCWEERSQYFSKVDSSLQEGHCAYALHQASLHRALATACQASWADTLAFIRRLDEQQSDIPYGVFSQSDTEDDMTETETTLPTML